MIATLINGAKDGVKMRLADDAYRIEIPVDESSDIIETETYALSKFETIGDTVYADFIMIEAS